MLPYLIPCSVYYGQSLVLIFIISTLTKCLLLLSPKCKNHSHLEMGHPVVVEIRRSRETLATGLAHMGLLPGVDPPMGVETAAGAESLLAVVADVGPLPRVDPHMALQQAGPVEHLAAGGAGQHPLVVKFVGFPRRVQPPTTTTTC